MKMSMTVYGETVEELAQNMVSTAKALDSAGVNTPTETSKVKTEAKPAKAEKPAKEEKPAKKSKKAKEEEEEEFDLDSGEEETDEEEESDEESDDEDDSDDEEESDEEETEEEDEEPATTLEDVIGALQKYSKKHSREKAAAILKTFKVSAVRELKPAQFDAVIKKLK